MTKPLPIRAAKQRNLTYLRHMLLSLVLMLFTASMGYGQQQFITTWKTDNNGPSEDNQIIVPATGDFNYIWENMANSTTGSGSGSGPTTITFPQAGTYKLSIQPTGSTPFEKIAFFELSNDDKFKILAVNNWGTISWSGFQFNGCSNLKIAATDIPDLSGVTDLSWGFSKSGIDEIPSINEWDMSNVTNLGSFLQHVTGFNQSLSDWDVSKVTDMSFMFDGATSFNQPLDSWDVSSLVQFDYMFRNATSFNQSLGAWNLASLGGGVGVFFNSGLSCENYSYTLYGWATNPNTNAGAIFHPWAPMEYSPAVVPYRDFLIDDLGWDISGDAPGSCSITLPGLITPGDPGNFITTWKTENPGESEDNQITIPIHPDGGYNFTIAWGDGNQTTWQDGDDPVELTHTYGAPGTYTVEITGNFPRIFFNGGGDRQKILAIEQWGDIAWSSMEDAFNGAINVMGNATDAPDLSGVTSLTRMFQGASVFNGNIGSWDVSGVTTMAGMFTGANSFNQDIGSWIVSNVTNMDGMFVNAYAFNQDISSWQVGNVTNMNSIFRNAVAFNQDLSGWDVAKVTIMQRMFFNTPAFNVNIGNWDVSKVTDMFEMLSHSGLSRDNYDATLIGWAGQGVQSGITLGADGLEYCASTRERQSLIGDHGWTISGDTRAADCDEGLTPDADNILYVDINVDTDATGYTGAGDSWGNAIPELADALKWAREQHDGGSPGWTEAEPLRIFVAKGEYKPLYNAADDEYTADGGRDNAFVLVANVQLYGGFEGTETTPEQRDWQVNETILSGDLNGNDTPGIPAENDPLRDDNAYHILISAGDVKNAQLDGFSITGGHANIWNNGSVNVWGTPINRSTGGGLYIAGNGLTVNRATFIGNLSFRGAGVVGRHDASADFFNSTFINNYSPAHGGGLHFFSGGSYALVNVLIANNTASSYGGGISNYGTLNLTNTTLTGNTANMGGGIYNNASITTLSNTILWGNTAGSSGNEIYNESGANGDVTLILSNSLYPTEGMVNNDSSGGTITVIEENSAHNDPQFASTNPTDADYLYLSKNSPAINAGSNALYTDAGGNLANDLDLAGNPRVYNQSNGGVIDMGAYEAYLTETVNNPPTDVSLSSTTVNQSAGANAVVGTLTSTDPDADDTFTYTLIAGSGDTDNANFNISDDSLRAISAATLEAGTYSVRIRTTDNVGDTFEKAFNITVVDDLGPTISVSSDKASLKAGEIATITFTLNEASVDFDMDDVTVAGGTLSGFSGAGATYTATLTPLANATLTATIDVAASTFTDGVGNSNAAATQLSIAVDTATPSGYAVSIDQTTITPANHTALSFTLSGAEVGADFDYTITSSGGGTPVTGNGTIGTASQQVSGIDVSGLANGILTLSVTLTHASGNAGDPATDNVTKAANYPPEITTSGGTTTFAEIVDGSPEPEVIDPMLTISDVDNNTLALATVSISGNFQTDEDVLAFDNDGSTMGNISGNYDAGAGVMTLISAGATATLAQWQAALRSVSYSNSSSNPNTANRTISFIANDGIDNSAPATKSIAVQAVNNAPVNNVPSNQSVDQDETLVFSMGNGNLVSVSDVDAGGGTVRVTLSATNGLITLGGTTRLTPIIGDGTGDGTMTFEGSIADINTALNGLTFVPTSGYNGAASLQIVTNDLGLTGSGGGQTDTDVIDIAVNAFNPEVTSVNAASLDETYKIADVVMLTVSFDQAVMVDVTGGSPTLLLETGSMDREATYESGSGSNTLTFNYTVQAGDLSADLDYASTAALVLNGASIKNASGDDAVLTLPAIGGANSIAGQRSIMIDGVAPTVTLVAVPADGYYLKDDVLTFTVQFDENVLVNMGGDVPYLELTIGKIVVQVPYISGSGTNSLIFSYTVKSGEQDLDGVLLGGNLFMNGSAIRDAAGNNAVPTLNTVAPTDQVFVYSVVPSVTLSGDASPNEPFTMTVAFSEAVTGFTLGDVVATNATVSNLQTIDNIVYTLQVVPSADGVVSLRVPENVAMNIAGSGNTASNTISYDYDATAPGMPKGLKAMSGDEKITLNWIANVESDVASYRIYGGTTTDPTTLIETVDASITTNTHTGLINGTRYYYRISAIDEVGNESVLTATVTAIPKGDQSITFNPLPDQIFDNAPLTLSARASSGLAVRYVSSNPAIASISGDKLILHQAGTVIITASQAGSDAFNAATPVTQALTITRGTITDIAFEDANFVYDGTEHRLTIDGNLPEGTSVTYRDNDQTEAGMYTVTATIDGGNNYEDLTFQATLTINKATQQINFENPGPLFRDAGEVPLQVSSSSGLPITLTGDDPLVATVEGTSLLVHRIGTVRVTATQAGDANHEAAEPVSLIIQVTGENDTRIRVHPAVSPNGDGMNDFLIIEGIKDFDVNRLLILSRTGIPVFEISGYNNADRVFRGVSNIRASNTLLPEGTYFYALEYEDAGKTRVKKGWFVLKY